MVDPQEVVLIFQMICLYKVGEEANENVTQLEASKVSRNVRRGRFFYTKMSHLDNILFWKRNVSL